MPGVVGDNSCNVEEQDGGEGPSGQACAGIQLTTVGDSSCNGEGSCSGLYKGKIEDNACNDSPACAGLGLEVGTGSCNSPFACAGFPQDEGCFAFIYDDDELEAPDESDCVIPLIIGENSCNGEYACFFSSSVESGTTQIGDNR